MNLVWTVFQIIVGYNLVLPIILYLFTFFIKMKPRVNVNRKSYDYAIIVTAYEQIHMLSSVIGSILKLNYTNFHIYVVADKCDISNLSITDSRVSIFRPERTLASNTRSHFYAINRFIRDHEIITIIDSDNLVDPQYINELNVFFDRGFDAVQGVRQAKNLDTSIACLDAARDLYYNFYDGKVLFCLGSSSTLAGSGMAFKTKLYRDCLEHLEISGAGFDKVLQAQIVLRNHRIAFASKAIVFDEKTTKTGQLINQRSRWFNTWFKYFGFGWEIIINALKNGSINQFLFGVVLLRPPLFLFILASFICLLVNVVFYHLNAIYWGMAMFIFLLGFFVALIKQNTNIKVYRSLISIPEFIFFQLISLCYSRTANKRSIATKH